MSKITALETIGTLLLSLGLMTLMGPRVFAMSCLALAHIVWAAIATIHSLYFEAASLTIVASLFTITAYRVHVRNTTVPPLNPGQIIGWCIIGDVDEDNAPLDYDADQY